MQKHFFGWLGICSLGVSSFLFSGCNPNGGFKTADWTSDSKNSHVGQPTAPFDHHLLSGEVQGGPMDRVTLIVYDRSERSIQLRVPIPGINGELDTEISKVPGSRVYLETIDGLPVLVLSIPAEYVLGRLGFEPDFANLDPTVLPSGRPLPFTPGGEPPKVSFEVRAVDRLVQIYLGINVIALFVPLNLDPMADLTFPIRNQSRQTIGYVSTVKKREPYLGGFFVSMVMPRQIASALDDHLGKVVVP